MRRTVVWSAALVVMLFMVGVACYAARSGVPEGRVLRATLVAVGSSGPTPYRAPPAITPPPGGISPDQAIAIARAQTHSGPGTLESAVVGTFGSYAGGNSVPGSSSDEPVWAVTFRGVFVHPCMAPPSPCEPSHHETLLLDYYKGTVLLFILRG